jgi:alginate O-acetyltransferase complex protein AlgJ
MRFFGIVLLLASLTAPLPAQTAPSDAQQKFAAELGAKFQNIESKTAAAGVGTDGWLFFSGELRLLSLGRFWGAEAAKVSRAHKPELADPVPAILDFQQQLKSRGIELVVVPVPPKAAIYPEKIVAGVGLRAVEPTAVLRRFYDELRTAGVDVLDLTSLFVQERDNPRGPVFCKTDSHWSGFGCVLAARAIADKVRSKLPPPGTPKEYAAEWKEVEIAGDLGGLLGHETHKPGPEKISVQAVTEKGKSAAIEPDPNSPLLLLGDSHTLVYHDFLAERAGLLDQLALQLGFAPDLIGTRGSGATPVRINLYRRTVKDAAYLAKKKVVVWCFAAREFTEATEGWAKAPVAK